MEVSTDLRVVPPLADNRVVSLDISSFSPRSTVDSALDSLNVPARQCEKTAVTEHVNQSTSIYRLLQEVSLDTDPSLLLERLEAKTIPLIQHCNSQTLSAISHRWAMASSRVSGEFAVGILKDELAVALGDQCLDKDAYLMVHRLATLVETLYSIQLCYNDPDLLQQSLAVTYPKLAPLDQSSKVEYTPFGISVIAGPAFRESWISQFGVGSAFLRTITPEIEFGGDQRSGNNPFAEPPPSFTLVVTLDLAHKVFSNEEVISHDLVTQIIKPFLRADESSDPIALFKDCIDHYSREFTKGSFLKSRKELETALEIITPAHVVRALKEEIVVAIANREIPSIVDPSKWAADTRFSLDDIHGARHPVRKLIRCVGEHLSMLPSEFHSVGARYPDILPRRFVSTLQDINRLFGFIHNEAPHRFDEAIMWLAALQPGGYKDVPQYMGFE